MSLFGVYYYFQSSQRKKKKSNPVKEILPQHFYSSKVHYEISPYIPPASVFLFVKFLSFITIFLLNKSTLDPKQNNNTHALSSTCSL